MKFHRTFRARLFFILALLLIATLGVQYYLNLVAQTESNELRERQEQALVAGITLGFNGLTSTDRLAEFLKKEGRPFFDATMRDRVRNIIIVNDDWEVHDSLDPSLLPKQENGTLKAVKLSEVPDLPPIMEGKRLGADFEKFPKTDPSDARVPGEAHAIPIETDKGRFYVMVILREDDAAVTERAARPLIYTLLILLASFAITFFLVWRFTRPIAELSEAAERVAAGELDVRVETSGRSDEMGELGKQFNEMTSELGRKQGLESKLREAERSAAVGSLGASVAHEIRNPLNYINLSLDHLNVEFVPDDPVKREEFSKIMRQLKTEVGRIEERVSELLDYARPRKPDFRELDVKELIDDSLKIVEVRAAESNIVSKVTIADDVPLIRADREYLRSLFSNLFINAVKAMEPRGEGRLEIAVKSDGDDLVVSVTDNGPGIAERDIKEIFKPYYSLDKTGTGLGLAIVQKVVEIHEGRIDVESQPNKGARFTVTLPTDPDTRQKGRGVGQ